MIKKKKSPYLNVDDILFAAGSALVTAGVIMLLLSSVILILTGAFIILKVLDLITLGWAMVFSPVWIPIAFVFSAAAAVTVVCSLINAGIFIYRLFTGKVGK